MDRKKGYIRHEEKLKVFGAHVRQLRRQKGLSIQALADLCNIEYSQLSRIERGIINTSLSNVFAIAEALDIRSKELFDFPD